MLRAQHGAPSLAKRSRSGRGWYTDSASLTKPQAGLKILERGFDARPHPCGTEPALIGELVGEKVPERHVPQSGRLPLLQQGCYILASLEQPFKDLKFRRAYDAGLAETFIGEQTP